MLELEDACTQLEAGLQAGDDTLVRRIIDCVRCSPARRCGLGELLHLAIRRQSFAVVLRLLRANTDVNYCDDRGRRAIHLAAETGNLEVLRAVVNAGSPINVVDGQGTSPLHACMENGHQRAALLLVDQGATVNRPRRYDTGEAPIHVAARLGMSDVIRSVVRRGGDVNLTTANRSSPLHLAVREKHACAAQALCECGANVNARDAGGRTPFLLAVQQTSVELVRVLLPHAVDLDLGDAEGSAPLHHISAAFPPCVSQSEVLRMLLAGGANVNKLNNLGRTALHLASGAGNMLVMRQLLDAGAELDVTDKLLGETPLNTAAAHNCIDAMRLLAERGADVRTGDKHSMTPLHKIHFSRVHQKYEATKLLLSHGARVNAEDDRGVKPLMGCVSLSIQGENVLDGVAALRRLVSAGAHLHPDLNRRSIQHSPLCWLTWQSHLDVAAFLVNAGWDLRAEPWIILPGRTPPMEQFLAKLRELLRQPTSLQALCRLVIRSTLSEAGGDVDIVPLIDELSAPRYVKQFLTLELEGDEL